MRSRKVSEEELCQRSKIEASTLSAVLSGVGDYPISVLISIMRVLRMQLDLSLLDDESSVFGPTGKN